MHLEHVPVWTVLWFLEQHLAEFNLTEAMTTMFSNNNVMKLEISNGKVEHSPNVWKSTTCFLKNPCFKEAGSREIKYYFELNEKKSPACQNCEVNLKQCLEENRQHSILLLEKKKGFKLKIQSPIVSGLKKEAQQKKHSQQCCLVLATANEWDGPTH